MAFGVILEKQQNQITLTIKGSLDRDTIEKLWAFKKELSSTQQVFFDLSRLRYIDSIGTGALLSLIRELHNQNISYVVVCSRGVVRDILVTLGFPALIGEEYFLPFKKKGRPAAKTKEEKHDDKGTQSSGLCSSFGTSLLKSEVVFGQNSFRRAGTITKGNRQN
jgi:anti-anti-sigma factor